MTDIDFGDLRKLEADLTAAADRIVGKVRPIVQKGALGIKKQLQDEAKGHSSFPAFPSSISYDTVESATSIEAEIGPDKGKRQGALGNLLYFGTSKSGGVLPDPQAALDAETPKFEKFLGDLLGESL